MTTPRTLIPNTGARADHLFPTLTPAQMTRMAAHGTVRTMHAGETLAEPGSAAVQIFLVRSGQIAIVKEDEHDNEIVALFDPGMFTGEATMPPRP